MLDKLIIKNYVGSVLLERSSNKELAKARYPPTLYSFLSFSTTNHSKGDSHWQQAMLDEVVKDELAYRSASQQ